MTASPVRLRVPATSANLGPGFDALGLALGLYDEIEAHPIEGPARVEIEGAGEGELPTDATHLVVRAVQAAYAETGDRAPGLHLRCRNRIPQQRGLGSSAAAIVAGITIARVLRSGRLDEAAAVRLAGRLEGHADNVAACLLGGLVLTWKDENGGADRAVRLEPDPRLRVLALVPAERSRTSRMRELLPASVPYADAVHNGTRASLLVHALTAAPELLLAATQDRLHQPYRAPAMASTAQLVQELRAAGISAVVSGAGPSVLVLGTSEREIRTASTIASSGGRSGWRPVAVPIDRTGARVLP